MRGDQVNRGDVVTYRGQQCRVLKAWKSTKDAPGGIRHPVGVVLELVPAADDDDAVTVWLGWPQSTAAEAARGSDSLFPRHDDEDATKRRKARILKERLDADLEAYPIEAL